MLDPLMLALLVATSDTIKLASVNCARCEITATTVATIGDSTGPGEIGSNPVLIADARGRFWVSFPASGGALLVFDSTGRFIRQVGRGGAGPGEFRFIGAMAASDRGIEIFDNLMLRWSTYDLDLTFRGSRPNPAQARSVVALKNGRAVIGAIVRTPNAIGQTLHLVDSAGNLTRSFGAPGVPGTSGPTNLFVRNVFRDDADDTFWSSNRTAYVFEKCSAVALSCVTYERTVKWFVPHASALTPSREKPPVPIFVGAHPDGPRYLWTLTLVPDSNWASALEQVPGTRTADGLRIAEPDKYWDTIIERIDLTSRAAVISLRIDAALLNFAGPSLAFASRETAEGVPKIEVVRLKFVGLP